MKKLSKKAKAAVIGSVAGLAAVAVGVGLGQPWREPAPVDPPDPPKQTETRPEPKPPEEKGPTLTVGGEEIPCTLYEGDGWSIYVPEGWTTWTADEEKGGLRLLKGREELSVQIESGGAGETYDLPAYTVIGRGVSGYGRTFCSGTEQGSWYVHTRAPGGYFQESRERWRENEKLLTAVARSFALDGEEIFRNIPLAQEPDWQIVDGETVLWLDKDGYPVHEEAHRVMEDSIRAWYPEAVGDLSGLYRLMSFDWTASYAGLTDDFIDVFSGLDYYAVKPGGETADFYGDWTDGWYYDSFNMLNLAVYHDGGDVERTKVLRGETARIKMWDAGLARELLGEPALQEDGFLCEELFDLTEADALTVRLYGREPRAVVGSSAETSYGVSRVEVLREGEVLQTLTIADAIEAEAGELAITDGYTECPDPNGWLETADLNGDGYTDLALLEFLPVHNQPMLCWLWDRAAGEFRYAGCVLNPEPGEEPGQVLSRSQDHAGAVRYIETYEVDENGRLRLAKRVTEDYRENQKTPVVTEEVFPAAGN